MLDVSSTTPDDFGEWIAQARVERGFATQSQFAEATGFASSYISRIETGERPPTKAFCVAIAPVLGLADDYVLRRAGLRSIYEPEQREDYSDVEETRSILATFPDEDSRAEAVELVNGLLRQMATRAKRRRREGDASAGARAGRAAARK